jgi:uncharacterized membrane protein YbjE (DUF340 family)
MSPVPVQRDERTVTIENASYRWGYLVVSFGVLVLVAYRSFVHGESNWDLLALVVVGGVVPNAYQGANHVLSRRWALTSLVTLVAAALVAAIIAFVRR